MALDTATTRDIGKYSPILHHLLCLSVWLYDMLSAGVVAEHMDIDDLSVYILILYLIELLVYDQCYTSVVKC